MSYSGLVITYTYDGDETTWESAINTFINAIDDDAALQGKFSYTVTKAREGGKRVHLAKWDSQETLQAMQAQSYFGEFSKQIKELAGDSLSSTPITGVGQTRSIF